MSLIHPRSVLVGALVALAVAVPVAILAQTLDQTGTVEDDSTWLIVAFVVIVAAMVAGGYAAASRRPDAPLTNGALAALSAYLLVQTVGAIRLLVVGDSVAWAAIPFFALLSTAAGTGGGLLADHRARHPRR